MTDHDERRDYWNEDSSQHTDNSEQETVRRQDISGNADPYTDRNTDPYTDRSSDSAEDRTPSWDSGSDRNVRDDIFAEDEIHFEAQDTPKKRYSYIPEDEYRERKSAGEDPDREQPSSQYRYQFRQPQNEYERSRSRRTATDRRHKKSMSNYAKAICTSILCGVIIGGCVLGSFAIGRNAFPQQHAEVTTNEAKLSTVSASSSDVDKITGNTGSTYTVSQINQQCGSSVVAITNKGISEVQTMFGTFQQESEGSGSGVIVSQTDSELLIVTNYHVVSGSEELTVCFNDSKENVYSAQIKGTDPDNDLAVIAINLEDIPDEVLDTVSIATLGDSESLEVGDQVVAIGNALGLGTSVTTGIISAVDREVTIEGTTSTLLQTDAAINPGNSGGALFNMKGELIGINSAKFASAEVEGMGFAIPMATAEPIIENLMTKETRTKLTKGYGVLNITGADVSSEASQQYGLPVGVYVSSVLEGGAADNAGIRKGDIITALDGTSLSSISELKKNLQYYAAGEEVEFTIQRNGENGYEEQKVTVTLDNADQQDSAALEKSYNEQNGQSDADSSESQNDQNGSEDQNTPNGSDDSNRQNEQGQQMDPFGGSEEDGQSGFGGWEQFFR